MFSNELHNFVYSDFDAINKWVLFLFIWSSMFSEMLCSASAVDTWIGMGDVRSIGLQHGLIRKPHTTVTICRPPCGRAVKSDQ